MPVQHVSGSYGNNVTPPLASTQSIPVSGSQLYNQMFQVPPPPLLGFGTPQFVQGPSGDLIQASSLIPTNPNYQWSNIMNQEFPPRIGANIVTTSTPPTTVATGQQSASAPLGREAPHIIADSGGQKVSGQSRGRKRERGRRKDIDSSDDESFDQEYSRWSEYARTRAKSKSPQPPKMPLFSGSGKPTFEAFMYQFERTAGRKGWTGETKTCKLLDCLTDSALEYTRKVHNTSVEYNVLRADLRRRFSTKEAPVSARRQLQFMRQQESEPLEEFSQRIYFMALDGFDKGNPEVVDQIATEAFLRGCRDKEAARSVLEKDPSSITQAVKMVKTYIANQRAIFGVRTSHSYAHRQVSFSDRDSTPERNQKKVQEKPSSSLEDELRNLVGVVQKLSVAVNDNIVARAKCPEGAPTRFQRHRYRSPTPPTGYRGQDQSRQTRSRSPSPYQGYRTPNRGSRNAPFRRRDTSTGSDRESEDLNKKGSSPAANAWPGITQN